MTLNLPEEQIARVMTRDTKLVYSTDPAQNQKCAKCKELISECDCPAEIGRDQAKASRFVAILRIEKANRGGKTVTVIDGLPKSELYLRELTTALKKKCGSGGTYVMDGRDGVIEIQGDKRELIRAHLEKQGIKHK